VSSILALSEQRSPALPGLLSLLQERTGLEIPASRVRACEPSIRRAMANAGIRDLHHYCAVLDSDEVAFDALVDELTIGETYFFRDPRQFSFLRTVAIPDVLRSRTSGHAFSAWSAGCASGEEPYSLAILLHEMGVGDRRSVVGTDISRRRLATARSGRYGKWSLRGVETSVVDRYFQREGATFELTPSIRSAARFQYLNLAEDLSSQLLPSGFDLIVCRNVLIYFDAVTIRRVLGQMVDRLACGGWLLLGASDPPLPSGEPCDVVMTEAGLAYRRRARRASDTEDASAANPPVVKWRRPPVRLSPGAPIPSATLPTLAVAPALVPETRPAEVPRVADADSSDGISDAGGEHASSMRQASAEVELDELLVRARRAYAGRDYEQAAMHSRRFLHEGGHDTEACILLVRSLANTGRASAAARACAGGLDADGMSAELFVLHALLLTELQRHDAAVIAARRALYLDREMVVAHVALGNALVRTGDAAAARRTFANAARLLVAFEPTSIVPASDGAPAAHLAAIVRRQLQRLAECAS
jgi:chemotaxis protein methyltransferase CheR